MKNILRIVDVHFIQGKKKQKNLVTKRNKK